MGRDGEYLIMKSDSILNKNLEALKRQNAPIYHWLVGREPSSRDSEKNIISDSRGFLDWRMPTGQGLFQAIPPEIAYANWIPRDNPDTSVTIIVGSNLGCGLNHLLLKTPDTHKVMVLEPRPEMLSACLSHNDYGYFLEKKRLSFIPPIKEVMGEMIDRLVMPCRFGKIFLRSDLPSRQLGPEYAIWDQHCREALDDLRVELNTIRERQDLMIGNELNNFQRATNEGSLMTLKDQGRGLSAVILGAGPSLDQFAPLLAENPGRALYATSFQALPALQNHGLKPHFCMCIETHEAIMKTYDRLDMEWVKDIPLIYSTNIHPEAVKVYPGPTIPLWILGGLASHILQGRELVMSVGGNVGVGLLNLMTWCGVNQILLVGQDFAWSGDRSHVSGHLASGNRFQFNPEAHMKLKNREDETIYSTVTYMAALHELERNLEKIKIPVYDLYGGGAMIKGSRSMTWDEVLNKDLLESGPGNLERFLTSLTQARSPRPWPLLEARSSQWAVFLRSVRKRLEKLFKKPKKNQKEIHVTLSQILFFIQQDPLYRPHLLNEIINFGGLIYSKKSYGLKELTGCKQILKRILTIVREIDRHLSPLPREQWVRT